jgi:hypothetical protein
LLTKCMPSTKPNSNIMVYTIIFMIDLGYM